MTWNTVYQSSSETQESLANSISPFFFLHSDLILDNLFQQFWEISMKVLFYPYFPDFMDKKKYMKDYMHLLMPEII